VHVRDGPGERHAAHHPAWPGQPRDQVSCAAMDHAAGGIRLPRTIPPEIATEMILTGRRITADERRPRWRNR
jgi:hypothetical protein